MTTSASKTGDKKINRLHDMRVHEVSLVDRAANKRKFLITKRAEGGDESVEKSEWSDEFVSELPDSSFLYIAPGGDRHFAIRNASGELDLSQVRKAIEQIKESELPEAVRERAAAQAQRLLEQANKTENDMGGVKKEDKTEGGDDTKTNANAELVKVLTSVSALFSSMLEKVNARKVVAEKGEDGPAIAQELAADLKTLEELIGVEKRGAKMSKDRLARFQGAMEKLQGLLGELIPEAVEAGKTAKNQPSSEDFEKLISMVEKLAKALTDREETLVQKAEEITKRDQKIAELEKSVTGSNSIPVERDERDDVKKSDSFTWPMDMNRPITRDTVKKDVSFFDD